MKKSVTVLLCVVFASSLCGFSSSFEQAATDSVRTEILSMVKSYYADFSARNWKLYQDHFWPKATLTTIWAPPGETKPRVVIMTIESFVEQAPKGPGSKPIFEESMTDSEVRAEKTLAHVWAHYTARFGDYDSVSTWSGVDAFTLMKHDGVWKIVALAYASNR